MQNVISYRIEWPTAKVDNLKGLYIVPFTIVAQTSDKSAETYCQKQYPTLMMDHPYNAQEMKMFIEMQRYLKQELNKKQSLILDGLYEYFQTHNWFTNTKKLDNLYQFNIERADCKFWNDSVPHLQLYATITIDINKVIALYDKNNWLRFEKYSSKIFSENFFVKFYQSLPTILVYQSLTAINDLLLKKIESLVNNKNSRIYKQIKSHYKINNIEKYKKKVVRLEVNKYQVTFLNFIDILKLRTKNNKIETAAALYFASQALTGNNKKENIKKQMTALTFKALHDLEQLQRGK